MAHVTKDSLAQPWMLKPSEAKLLHNPCVPQTKPAKPTAEPKILSSGSCACMNISRSFNGREGCALSMFSRLLVHHPRTCSRCLQEVSH